MRLALKRHPDSPSTAASALAVEIARPRAGLLELRYLLSGEPGDLQLPPPAPPARADELWRHTCFEVFVRPGEGDGYCEFNFAPSTGWAAYRFSGYRAGMADLAGIGAPVVRPRASAGVFEMRVTLDLDGVPALPVDQAWRLGLSAIVEDVRGEKSWWALAHAPGQPDFHHPDSFAFDLPVADRP